MKTMTHRPLHLVASLLLLLVVAAGCRSYGGYGTQAEDVLAQIEEVNRLFAEELERARADLNALERVAGANDAVATAARQFGEVVVRHDSLVSRHTALAGEAGDFGWIGTYRKLNRTLGAMVTDHRIIRDHYARILGNLGQAFAGISRPTAELRSRYQTSPPFYERIEHGLSHRSVAQILATSTMGVPSAIDLATEADSLEGSN